jgi:hypothetical protein
LVGGTLKKGLKLLLFLERHGNFVSMHLTKKKKTPGNRVGSDKCPFGRHDRNKLGSRPVTALLVSGFG